MGEKGLFGEAGKWLKNQIIGDAPEGFHSSSDERETGTGLIIDQGLLRKRLIREAHTTGASFTVKDITSYKGDITTQQADGLRRGDLTIIDGQIVPVR